MKKLVIGLILISIFALTSVVSAQTTLEFDVVQIQFWPEYDRPEMLVIYTLELPQTQTLPVEVSVRMPVRVASPTAVAALEGAQLVTREYSLTTEGDWTVVTLTADSSVIQVEYYDPLLSQSDPLREYSFEWVFDYTVKDLVVAFKQPVHATDLTFSPNLGLPGSGSDGLNFYSASFGQLPAGEPFEFSIQYQKSDDLLSVETISQPQVESAAPTEADSAQQSGLPDWGWMVVGIGAVFVAAGGAYLWFINTPTAFSRYRAKKARSGQVRSAGRAGAFCHQCGTRAEVGDKFCRECGEKLRK